MAKFVTHASAHSTYLINGFIEYFSALMHSTCTRKPTESHQTLPSPCVILKAIRAGVGWVWLVRLVEQLLYSLLPIFRAVKAVRMRKFGSMRLRQLLAVKLTAAVSKSRTIDVLPHRRLSDREYSAEDVYKVCSCPLVVR